MQIRSQAMEGDAQELVALLDAVVGLLDAGGNPDGLGTNLKGVYARTWQAIVENLSISLMIGLPNCFGVGNSEYMLLISSQVKLVI